MTYTIKNTLAELKEACKARGFKVTGNKALLLAYLTGQKDGQKKKKGLFRWMRKRKDACQMDAGECFAPENPPFEKKDLTKKLEICGVSKWNMCAICRNEGGVSQGDHVWERKGFIEETGYYGIIKGKWNTLPVCSTCNHSYKIIYLTDGTKKNIGCHDLTEKELKLVKPEDVRKMTMVVNWKVYAKKRGAVLRFRLSKAEKKYIEDLKGRRMAYIEQEERNIQRFLQESAQD